MFCTERSVVDCSVLLCLRLYCCFHVFVVYIMFLCAVHCAYSINNNNNNNNNNNSLPMKKNWRFSLQPFQKYHWGPNILNESRDPDHAPVKSGFVIKMLGLDIAYRCSKYDHFCFSHSRDMVVAHQKLNGSRNLVTPLSGTVCHCGLALDTTHIFTKFEVSNCSHYEDTKGDTKYGKFGSLA